MRRQLTHRRTALTPVGDWVHPEELVPVPENAGWPRPAAATAFEGPAYPATARRDGVEGGVLVAFVIDKEGEVEYPTISIIESPSEPAFVRSVCVFLRTGTFTWLPHAPVRGLIVMPFVFTLTGGPLSTPLPPPQPDRRSIRDSLRHLSPSDLSTWIESRPHCL